MRKQNSNGCQQSNSQTSRIQLDLWTEHPKVKRYTLRGSISAIFTICIISPFSMEINIYGTRNKTASKGGPPFQLGLVVQGSKQIIRNPGKQTSQKFFVLTKMAEKMKCWHIHSSRKNTLSLRCQITSRSPHWTFKRQCYSCIEVSG